MSNELRILPLRKYEVTYTQYLGQEVTYGSDAFTADLHNTDKRGITRFFRTGNVIREYHMPLQSIIITPVDEEVPA